MYAVQAKSEQALSSLDNDIDRTMSAKDRMRLGINRLVDINRIKGAMAPTRSAKSRTLKGMLGLGKKNPAEGGEHMMLFVPLVEKTAEPCYTDGMIACPVSPSLRRHVGAHIHCLSSPVSVNVQ